MTPGLAAGDDITHWVGVLVLLPSRKTGKVVSVGIDGRCVAWGSGRGSALFATVSTIACPSSSPPFRTPPCGACRPTCGSQACLLADQLTCLPEATCLLLPATACLPTCLPAYLPACGHLPATACLPAPRCNVQPGSAEGSSFVPLGEEEVVDACLVTLVRPQKKDRIKVLRETHVRAGLLGNLIGVDNSDGIVKLEGTNDMQIIDLALLGRLA